jgi:hypothetical protein
VWQLDLSRISPVVRAGTAGILRDSIRLLFGVKSLAGWDFRDSPGIARNQRSAIRRLGVRVSPGALTTSGNGVGVMTRYLLIPSVHAAFPMGFLRAGIESGASTYFAM